MHEARVAVVSHAHDTRDRAVVEDAAEPVEPSKQVNVNSLPATNRRAASAFIGSARTGVTASRLTNATAARRPMSYSPLTI